MKARKRYLHRDGEREGQGFQCFIDDEADECYYIDIFVRDYYINVLFEHIPELRNGSCYKLKGLFLIG